jgi:peptide/nickel transport system substrate-binding protein
MRIAITDPLETLSHYDRPTTESAPIYSEVYQTLVGRDEYKNQIYPILAKSWKRVDPTTWEFELRDDIVFHSGNKFTADDIVHIFTWAADPKNPLPSKGPYLWIDKVEKTGPYSVRIRGKQPYAADITSLAYNLTVYDSVVHKGLANTADYGRVSGSGTGPYRMTSFDRNKGITIERFDAFTGDKTYIRTPTKRIQAIPIPDAQTQVAQLLTGGIDMIRDTSADLHKELAKNPALRTSSMPSGTYVYIHIDSIARSGFKPLTDVRVRKAFVMAVDRKAIADNFVAGGDKAEVMDTICFSWMTACAWSVPPYAYNPAEAKRLLAEAGYPNGLEIPFWVHAPYRDIAQAVSGMLREVGITAAAQPLTIGVYFKKRDDGELTTFIGSRPTASLPDILFAMDSYFNPRRDYWRDDAILAAYKASAVEIDDAKRTALLRPVLDRINEQAYVLPISSLPFTFVHSKDVRVERNLGRAAFITVADFFWN